MTNVVNRFAGIYEFLSNFYPAPVTLDGVVYPTVENAFQAAKTGDMELRKQFAQCSPGYAKKLGRQVALRSDWESVKDGIMYELLKQKFASGTSLADMLLSTGSAYLCEGNMWHDNHFGACSCDRCVLVPHTNMLGIMLMRLREELE